MLVTRNDDERPCAVTRRNALLGGASGAILLSVPTGPAMAAFPPKNFADPSGFATGYLSDAPVIPPGEVELFGVRFNYLDTAKQLIAHYNDYVAFLGRLEELPADGVTLDPALLTTGSSTINGLLTALTSVNAVAGIAATVISMDAQLNEINRKLDEISKKVDLIYEKIAKLREEIREDSVIDRITEYRAALATQFQRYQNEKQNFGRRLNEAAEAAKKRDASQRKVTAAKELAKSARSRSEKRAAQADIDKATASLASDQSAVDKKTAATAEYFNDHYREAISDIANNIYTIAYDLMNYTMMSEVPAPTATVAISLATAVGVQRAIHAELGRVDLDFEPVRQFYDEWRAFADKPTVARSIGSASATYAAHREDHLNLAKETCVGRTAVAERGEYPLAWSVIHNRLIGGGVDAKSFLRGVFFWVDVSPVGAGSRDLQISAVWKKYDNYVDYLGYADDYARKSCQGDKIDPIYARDAKAAQTAFDKLVRNPSKRSVLKAPFESFYEWRAHVLAAQDSMKEVAYLKDVSNLLRESITPRER